jgi:molecular chaperone HtpG
MAPTIQKKVSSNYIHDDITFSILSKLPIKSIKRFSCACKSWSFLFENPNFITMFRNNLLSKSHPLYDDAFLILNHFPQPFHADIYVLSSDRFENKVKLDLTPSLPLENGYEHIRILGSAINGTLCIYDYVGNTSVALWNPVTEEVKAIPPITRKVTIEYRLHGFGYGHIRDDYKVIQYVDSYTFNDNVLVNECFWNIYSLNSNSWKKINFDMPSRYQDFDTEVYLNGMCHWCGGTHTEA